MNVLLLSTDLMAQSKIAGAAQSIGLTIMAVPNMGRLLETAIDPAIVVLDLATQGFDPASVLAELRALSTPPKAVLAFGPHVHEARLQSAVEAGCDAVFTRGQFFGQTAEILKRYAGQAL